MQNTWSVLFKSLDFIKAKKKKREREREIDLRDDSGMTTKGNVLL